MDATRLPLLTPSELDGAQRALYDAVVKSPRAASPGRASLIDDDGHLGGPFNALLYSPALGTAVSELGTAVRYGTGLTARAREIAILEVARHSSSGYEWATHATAGRAAGLTADELGRISKGQSAPTLDGSEQLVQQTVQALLTDRDLPDTLYAQCRDELGEPMIVELVLLVGYYQLLALLLQVARTPTPVSQEPM